jgi:hypothetical protein
MPKTNLLEFIQNIDEFENILEFQERQEKGFEILAGLSKFEGNIDTLHALNQLLQFIKKASDEEIKGKFMDKVKEKAAGVEKIIKNMDKKRIEQIINMVDSIKLNSNEKKLFDFVEQAENFLWQTTLGKSTAESGTRGSLDAKTISIRSFNMIPVKIIINRKSYFGVLRAPDGVITWEKTIDKWENETENEKDIFDLMVQKYGKQKIKDMGEDELNKLMNKEAKELYKTDENTLLKKLPLIKKDDYYIVEKSKRIKDLMDRLKLKFVDDKKASQKIASKIISIMKKNDKYKNMDKEEIVKILTKHEVRTWAINNIEFWKMIKSFF